MTLQEEVNRCILNNQSQILATMMLLVRKTAPDLCGKGGEVDRYHFDLMDRYRKTGDLLRRHP